MSALLRLMFPLVAYLCVGTVLSAAIGYGYLRRSGKLSDETLFRITALVHGVDLEEMKKQAPKPTADTPGEEPSFAEQQQRLHAATLHSDAKEKQLADMLISFDAQLKQLSFATSRYASLKGEVETYLRQQSDLVIDDARQKVREQLEGLIPKKQAKPLLIKMIEANEIDEVILLLGSMNKRSREAILKTFDTEDDIEMLARLHDRMLAGDPAKPFIDGRLDELKQLKEQDK